MGPVRAAVVQYTDKKSCFLHIPAKWSYSRAPGKMIVFEITYQKQKEAFFSWSGDNAPAQPNDVVEINGVYAHKLGIGHGEEVLVKEMVTVPSCHQVWVEPVTADDWEVLEINHELVRSELLNQVRIVWVGQILPVWINKSVMMFLKIKKLSSSSRVGKFEMSTEVHVKPKFRDSGIGLGSDSDLSSITSPGLENSLNFPSPPSETVSHGPLEGHSSHTVSDTGDHESNSAILAKEGNHRASPTLTSSSFSQIFGYFFGFGTLVSDREKRAPSPALKETPKVEVIAKVKFSECLQVLPLPVLEDDGSPASKGAACSLSKNYCCVHSDRACDSGIQKHRHLICTLARQPTTVFASARSFPVPIPMPVTTNLFTCIIGKMTKVLPPDSKAEKQQNSKDETDKPSKNPTFYVKVVLLESLSDCCLSSSKCAKLLQMPLSIPGRVLVSELLCLKLGLKFSCKVLLEAGDYKVMPATKLSVYTSGNLSNSVEKNCAPEVLRDKFNQVTEECCPLVLNWLTPLKIEIAGVKSTVYVSPWTNKKEGTVYQMMPLEHTSQIFLHENRSEKECPSSENLDTNLSFSYIQPELLGGISDLMEKGLLHLKKTLQLTSVATTLMNNSSVLCGLRGGALGVSGARGSGKSTLVKTLCFMMSRSPYYVHPFYVSCKMLKGKRPDAISRYWNRLLANALYSAPSVIVFDDLDHLAGPTTLDRNDVQQEHIAQIFIDLLKTETTPGSLVAIIATFKSKDDLNSLLVSSSGQHVFQRYLRITPLTLQKRKEILKSVILQKDGANLKSLDGLDLTEMAKKVEGATAQDLKAFGDKVIYSACQRAGGIDDISLNDEDFKFALDGFVPFGLQSIHSNLAKITKNWNDVGGLTEIKKILEQTFLWPSKFPDLFAQSPIQVSSGLLLYGPPGTGKTLLATVVAKECGLAFISIKGPELLSKYIGASEQAVRDLFDKAISAKPCLLFFDEFDAIAPRRGNDTTGVTDRVVNQLLTQMDGVEERTGVYLLAATSRPDLIDPALLRPGRLDKCLYCPLPRKEEQLDILRILSKPMNLDPRVDWNQVVESCTHFSGADLQALLFNAQLLAIQEADDPHRERHGNQYDSDPGCSSPLQWFHMPSLEKGASPILLPEKKRSMQRELETLVTRSFTPRPSDPLEHQRQLLDEEAGGGRPAPVPGTAVTQHHLKKAARKMKPSVTRAERRRYKKIYETFVQSKSGDFTEVDVSTVQRVTLA